MTTNMNDFVGMVFTSITRTDDAITFEALLDGRKFVMRHQQDCCEEVYIESIVGDLDDLLYSPILMAEEATNTEAPPPDGEYADESHTWTFYKFATAKGYVDIRWFGSSNGYYSETASIREVTHGLH